MNTTIYTQPKTPGDVVIQEIPFVSCDTASFKAGSAYTIGQVLGRILTGAASSAAKSGGNTGNGVLTLDATTPVLAGAKAGVYTVRCIAAATNSGTFRIEDPDGNVLGDVAVGSTFSDDIKFAIADGATDFVLGDGFDITVAKGSLVYAPLNLTAQDGTARAAGISLTALESSASLQVGQVLARSGAVMADNLDWPAGISDTQKANAIAELAVQSLMVRANI